VRYNFYGAILDVVFFQNRDITRNSDKIWPYSSSRGSLINLVSIENPHATSY